MSDTLVYGRRVRILNVIDDYNREVLAVEPNFPGLRPLADEWMDDYNRNHPHSTLGGLYQEPGK